MANNTPDEKTKKKTNVIAGIIVLLIFFAGVKSCFSTDDDNAVASADTKPKTRQEIVEANFSQWDGSHKNLTALIKKSMNDPESYEHVETRYMDRDSVIVVWQTFSGKNAFGGRVKQGIMAITDNDGNILETSEFDPFAMQK